MINSDKRDYIPSLDALRAIAIIMVILRHSGRNYSNLFFSTYSEFAVSMWMGVDLFFVLSGFLITRILLDTLHEKGGVKKFYIRRILRIFPAYFLLLTIVYTIFPLFLKSDGFKSSLNFMNVNSWYFWLHSSNFLFLIKQNSLINGTIPFRLGHLWSLSVEEHFYLIYPLILLFIKNKKQLLALFIFTILSQPLFRYYIAHQYSIKIAYTITFDRLDGFAWGGLLALIMRESWFPLNYIKKKILAILTFIILVISLYGIESENVKSLVLILPLYYFYFTYLIAYCSTNTFNKTQIFNLLCTIGKYSYGLYLFHQPINYFLRFYLNPNRALLIFLYPIVLLSITFLVAYVSFELFEKRILKLKKYFEYN